LSEKQGLSILEDAVFEHRQTKRRTDISLVCTNCIKQQKQLTWL